MKKLKLFTLALTTLFTMGVSAETIFSFTVTAESVNTGTYEANGGTAQCTRAMSTGGSNEITVGSQTFYKFNSSTSWIFTLSSGTFQAGDVFYFTVAATTSDKNGKGVAVNNIPVTGDIPGNGTALLSYTVTAGDAIEGQSSVTVKRNDSDTKFGTIEVIRGGGSPADSDPLPQLKVNKTSVDLHVTPEVANPTAEVVFTGKNLTPGNYAVVVPNLAGLSVEPQVVSVDDDGVLNAGINLSYASAEDVAAASTSISLTIGDEVVQVTLNYSASHTIAYASSINIEQLVLDNGTGYDIRGALAAANIEFDKIDALDSLNDAKTERNEPYLGLKLKTAGAYIKLCVQAGKALNVKFGYIGSPVNVTVNGVDPQQITTDTEEWTSVADNVDHFITFTTSTKNTVVFKQIMVGENIAPVTLPAKTAVDEVEADAPKAHKVIHNGQIVIIRGDKEFNLVGAEL